MRAAENTSYGDPQVLSVTERERPEPGPKQVLVEVVASAVTHGDRRLRAADFPGGSALIGRLMFGVFSPRHPTGGTMLAGRVVAVGEQVRRFAVGDDVFGSVMHGAWAEFVAVDETAPIAKMPTGFSYQEAAALPYGGLTAQVFLRDMAKVKPGERVLVVGAAGGVGRMAVQMAKHLGAEVTGVCGEGAELVRELGADTVIDYRTTSFTDLDETWDVILDTVEGAHFQAYRPALTPTGRYLSLYMSGRLILEMMTTAVGAGPRAIGGAAMGNAEQMEQLAEVAEAGGLRAIIAARFPLDAIADANAFLETERLYGDVVVDVQPAAPKLDRCA